MDPKLLLNHPQLKHMDKEKLQFLLSFASPEKDTTPKDMASTLMAASASAKAKGKQFNPSEMNLIVDILKQNMSEPDRKKADMILNMMRKK